MAFSVNLSNMAIGTDFLPPFLLVEEEGRDRDFDTVSWKVLGFLAMLLSRTERRRKPEKELTCGRCAEVEEDEEDEDEEDEGEHEEGATTFTEITEAPAAAAKAPAMARAS